MKKIGIIIFIVALIVGVALANTFAFGKVSANFFSFNFKRGVVGSGNVAGEKRDVSDFKGVDVGGVFEVEIVAQKDFSVEIEADDNLLPLIKTEVHGNILRIETEKRLNTKNPIRVRISAPNIEELEVSGASKLNLTNLNNESLKLDTSGASKVTIEGITKELNIEVSGASKVEAEKLTAENADVDASGASNVSISVSGDLKSDASGASKITYSGTPKNIEKRSSGASKIKER